MDINLIAGADAKITNIMIQILEKQMDLSRLEKYKLR